MLVFPDVRCQPLLCTQFGEFVLQCRCYCEEKYALLSFTSLFHTFGKNLAKCKRLKELEVVNAYSRTRVSDQGQESYDCSYSYALISALTPMLEKDRLQIFKLRSGGLPSGFCCGPAVLSRGETHDGEVIAYFLEALLSCTKLHTLDILAIQSPANNLVEISNDVSEELQQSQKPVNLKGLHLRLEPGILRQIPERFGFVPFVGHFTSCHSLESIYLEFNNLLWGEEENLKQVKCLLQSQTKLSSVELHFGGLRADERIFEMIEGCARQNLCKLDLLTISRLENVETDQLFQLLDDLVEAGLNVREDSTGYEQGSRPGDHVDVECLTVERSSHKDN